MSFPSRFRGRCAVCHEEFPAGELIDYDRATKKARHASCRADTTPVPQEGREPDEPSAPTPARRRTRPRLSAEESHARIVEHGRADVVLCARCGGSASPERPVVHVTCEGADPLPF